MKQNIFKSIADLRFAIFILLMIAALSIIGTVIEQDQIERGFSRGENPWVFDLLQGLRGHFRIKAMAPDLGEHEGAIPSFRNALRIGLVRGSGPEFDRCIGAAGLDAILSRALK